MKPCPFCQQPVDEVFSSEDGFSCVKCRKCGASGPEVHFSEAENTRASAIQRWNVGAEAILKLKTELSSTMSSMSDINDCLNMITMERDQLADQVRQLEEVNIELKMVASHALQAMNETAEAGMRMARNEEEPLHP